MSNPCLFSTLSSWSSGCSAWRMAHRADEPQVVEIGARRELFVDDFLIDRRDGLELRLQSPVPREIVLEHDAPWEGSGCGYHTIFRDGEIVRMYYIAADLTNADGTKLASRPLFACYAESRDGLHWTKPELGLFEFAGSKKNNIVWSAPKLDNFTPFKDTNPACPPGERYKAVAAGPWRAARLQVGRTAFTGRRWRTGRSSPRGRSTPRTTPSGTRCASTTGVTSATSTTAFATSAWRPRPISEPGPSPSGCVRRLARRAALHQPGAAV